MGCSISVEQVKDDIGPQQGKAELLPFEQSKKKAQATSSGGQTAEKAGGQGERAEYPRSQSIADSATAAEHGVPNGLATLSLPGAAPSSAQRARKFRYKELADATNQWDEDVVLGEGSFGKVYRGEVEEDEENPTGQKEKVAIKRLNEDSFQGYEEWLAEILLLEKLHHPNLVRLIGYCAEKGEAMLVYELCEHGSVDSALFESDDFVLTWEQRVNMSLDAARGLAFLHENNVIHRDFKLSNILIANDMHARLTDFGMARAGPDGNQTHISTRVMGTMGYLDPMYMETGRLTRKSDVYAFGVMLLELLTGRRTMGESGSESLTTWIRPYLQQRKPDLNLLVDPKLGQEYSKAGAIKLAILAKHCIHDDPGYRPEMQTLAENLELVDIEDP